jgi:hypothetical protein
MLEKGKTGSNTRFTGAATCRTELERYLTEEIMKKPVL